MQVRNDKIGVIASFFGLLISFALSINCFLWLSILNPMLSQQSQSPLFRGDIVDSIIIFRKQDAIVTL